VIEMLAPVRERYEELRAAEAALQAMLAAGAEKARAIAADTVADARDVMGVGPPRGYPRDRSADAGGRP
jgi:tryptophanyl-tRNA synthetase